MRPDRPSSSVIGDGVLGWAAFVFDDFFAPLCAQASPDGGLIGSARRNAARASAVVARANAKGRGFIIFVLPAELERGDARGTGLARETLKSRRIEQRGFRPVNRNPVPGRRAVVAIFTPPIRHYSTRRTTITTGSRKPMSVSATAVERESRHRRSDRSPMGRRTSPANVGPMGHPPHLAYAACTVRPQSCGPVPCGGRGATDARCFSSSAPTAASGA